MILGGVLTDTEARKEEIEGRRKKARKKEREKVDIAAA